jgi:hypothetical protein
MRELDHRIWNEHHQTFSAEIDRAFGSLRTRLARFIAWDGSLTHLAALALSAAITALTFNGTTAA